MKLDWVAAARIFEGLLMDETNHFEMYAYNFLFLLF